MSGQVSSDDWEYTVAGRTGLLGRALVMTAALRR